MTDRIARVMREGFPTLDPAMPIRQAAGLLLSSELESAPVVDASGALVGILMQKDCFRPALQASYYRQWTGIVADRMGSPVTTIEADMDIVAAAETFLYEPHRTLPVVRAGGIVGMLRREDVLRRLLELG